MKILLDTNVLVSAFLSKGGYCHEVLDHAASAHELWVTPFIKTELSHVLRNKFHLSDTLVKEILKFTSEFYIQGETAHSAPRICRDSKDDQVLADAIANGLDAILTGDNDLLDLGSHKGIRILSPKDYWNFGK